MNRTLTDICGVARARPLAIAAGALFALFVQWWMQRHLGPGTTILGKAGMVPFALVAMIAAIVALRPGAGLSRFAHGAVLLLLFVGVLLAGLQVAFEHRWLDAPGWCGVATDNAEISAALGKHRARCDVAGFTLFGVSIAGWSALMALGLLALSIGWPWQGRAATTPPAFPRGTRLLACAALLVAILPVALIARSRPVTTVSLPPITANDRTLGSDKAPILLVEYISLTCPHCAQWSARVFPAFRDKWVATGQVRYVVRDYPLDAQALTAGMLARCAPASRYIDVIRAMLAAQTSWVGAKDPVPRLAALAGLDPQQARHCLADTALRTMMLTSRLNAEQAGVAGIPALVIDGRRVPASPEFDILDAQLRQEKAQR